MRLLREPLLHFVILGTLVFAAHHWWSTTPHRIDLSADVLAGLRQDHLRRTGSLPSPDEENALVQRYVDTEILCREALALGLDRGDVIVRRRLEQKMEFILENRNAPDDPTDAQLQRFLEQHAERYTEPARLSFIQVFVGTDRHGNAGKALAEQLRTRLLEGADPETLGDPFLHGNAFKARSSSEISALFGAEFAHQLKHQGLDTWSQPLRSSFGWHLVRVHERVAAALPSLAAVRERVLPDWEEEQRAVARDAGLAELRKHYQVRKLDK